MHSGIRKKKNERPCEPESSGARKITHRYHNRSEEEMEEKKEYVIWIIRWAEPYELECKSGTREEIEEYAREKQRVRGGTYIIN